MTLNLVTNHKLNFTLFNTSDEYLKFGRRLPKKWSCFATFSNNFIVSSISYFRPGFNLEKTHGIPAPKKIEALYSFRVSKSIRGIGFREDLYLRNLFIQPNHGSNLCSYVAKILSTLSLLTAKPCS